MDYRGSYGRWETSLHIISSNDIRIAVDITSRVFFKVSSTPDRIADQWDLGFIKLSGMRLEQAINGRELFEWRVARVESTIQQASRDILVLRRLNAHARGCFCDSRHIDITRLATHPSRGVKMSLYHTGDKYPAIFHPTSRGVAILRIHFRG